MGKIYNIQALRGIAVLFVVLFHLLPIEHKYGGSKTILPDFFQFGMFGVDLFFVISGFVMVTVSRGKFQIPQEALKFIYHRAARIYPTYWIYSILVLIVFLLNPSMVNSAQGNQVNILSSFLLLPASTLPLVNVGWTLIHEIYFYLVFFIIFLFVPEKRLTTSLLLWGAIITLWDTQLGANTPLTKLLSHPMTIEFIAGGLIAHIYYKKSININNWIIAFLISLSFFILVFGYFYYQGLNNSIEPSGWWRIVIFGIPALLIVYCLANIEKNGYILYSSLIKIGNASYSIYLSHVLTLSFFGRVWSSFSSNEVLDNIIVIPILFTLVIAVGFLSYSIIEKPLLSLTRKFF